MSLLAQVNQPNKDAYYFALDSTPVDPTVTAPAFTATGVGQPANVGTFSARGDGVPAGIDMFNLQTAAGTTQFSIGMVGTAAGANSGNNMAIFSYDDTGAFLAAPMTINRATGNIVTSGQLVTGGNLTVTGDLAVTGALPQSAFTFSASVAPATPIDLEATSANNVLIIPVPAAAQKARIFKVNMSGGWSYSSGSIPPVNMIMYCSSASEAAAPASGDTVAAYTGVVNAQQMAFGAPAMLLLAGPAGVSTNSSSSSFLVQNAAGASVSNLYFIITPTPADGSQAIGIINVAGSGLSAVVEAYL